MVSSYIGLPAYHIIHPIVLQDCFVTNPFYRKRILAMEKPLIITGDA